MAEDIEQDFKQIKISRLTLGLIMSVAVTSGVIVWNAAQVAGRISELEQTVNRVEADMGELQIETDPTILIRLDSLEEKNRRACRHGQQCGTYVPCRRTRRMD